MSKDDNTPQKRIDNGAGEVCPSCNKPATSTEANGPGPATVQPCGCLVADPVLTDGGRETSEIPTEDLHVLVELAEARIRDDAAQTQGAVLDEQDIGYDDYTIADVEGIIEDVKDRLEDSDREVATDGGFDEPSSTSLRAEWWELTSAQQAMLLAVSRVAASDAHDTTYGMAIKREAESAEWLDGEIGRGRLYPSLEALVEHGLLEKATLDARKNSWKLTERGRDVIEAHYEQVQETLLAADIGEPVSAEPAATHLDDQGGR